MSSQDTTTSLASQNGVEMRLLSRFRHARRRTNTAATSTASTRWCNATDLIGFTCLFVYGLYLHRAQTMIDHQLSVYKPQQQQQQPFPGDSTQGEENTQVDNEQSLFARRGPEWGVERKFQTLQPTYDYQVHDGHKYLVFRPIVSGQGLGNHMHGLLAVHLLGLEFNRTVCVATDWDDFYVALQYTNPDVFERCNKLPPMGDVNNTIVLVNFSETPNECLLKERLLSDTELFYITANTYPRWPTIPDNFFAKFYEPTSALKNTLPYGDTPPETVVHLRRPDPDTDERQGLDDVTLTALGELLPRDTTFLVTNDVSLYSHLEQTYGWKHPNWSIVHHSAFYDTVVWGGTDGSSPSNDLDNHHTTTDAATATKQSQVETLQLWSDWYTLLTATSVYHTHSDFSLSAVHWSNIQMAKTISGGVNDTDGSPILSEESWRRDGETARLMDRKELNLCDQPFIELGIMEKGLAGLLVLETDDMMFALDDDIDVGAR